MLIGYARVSKADGSQSLDLQQDALRAEGVEATKIPASLTRSPEQPPPGAGVSSSSARMLHLADLQPRKRRRSGSMALTNAERQALSPGFGRDG